MKKVKLPALNPTDLGVLATALAQAMHYPTTNFGEKAIVGCLADFYKKVVEKTIFPAPSTVLKIHVGQACAFLHAYTYNWSGIAHGNKDPYVDTTLKMIISEIDRQIQ